jgi:hypothetical protein
VQVRNHRDDHSPGGDDAGGCDHCREMDAHTLGDRSSGGPGDGEYPDEWNRQRRAPTRRPRRPQPYPDRSAPARRAQDRRHHDVDISAGSPAHHRAEAGRQ